MSKNRICLLMIYDFKDFTDEFWTKIPHCLTIWVHVWVYEYECKDISSTHTVENLEK